MRRSTIGVRARGAIASRSPLFLLAFAAACGGTELGPPENPVPIVQSVDPSVLQQSSSPALVTVVGLGFAEGAEARWNGEGRATTFGDSRHLTVTLAPQDLTAGSGEIDVVNPAPGGGASGPMTVLVAHPTPTLTSISPTQAAAILTTELTLHAQGTEFLVGSSGTVLQWNRVPLATAVTTDAELSATVPDYLLRVGHTAEITVKNAGPGGGTSSPLYFVVENPLPALIRTEPPSVPIGTDVVVDLIGSGFVHGASVSLDGSPLSPVSISSTRVKVIVPGALTAGSDGTASIQVTNPGPGGGTSNAIELTVWLDPPRIDDLFPAVVFAGAGDVPMIISGADFHGSATVTLDGTPQPATVVSSSRIELIIPGTHVSAEGTIEVTVINPNGAGQASATLRIVNSPASGSVLLAERGHELALLDATGAQLHVVPTPGGSYRVDASPIGSTALYQNGRIFEIDPYTGITRRVSTTSADAALHEEQWGRYSADGAWIYFMGAAGSRWELWRTPTAGGGTSSRLLGHFNESFGYPSPSHRGDRVVYANGVSQGSAAQLTILDLTTSLSTPLGVQGGPSRWTPGDDWIVYWTWNRELRAVRPDGTGDFALTSGIQVASGFDISPLGDQIIAAREDGTGAVLIDFPSGTVHAVPGSGSVGSMAWYGP